MERTARKATTCLLLGATICIGQAAADSTPPGKPVRHFLPAQVRRMPPPHPREPLLTLLESPPIGYYMDFGSAYRRYLDDEKRGVRSPTATLDVEDLILAKILPRDRKNARIETFASGPGNEELVTITTNFSIETTRRFPLDLATIHPGFGHRTLAYDLPVRHTADFRLRIGSDPLADTTTGYLFDDQHLLLRIDAMSSEASIVQQEEEGLLCPDGSLATGEADCEGSKCDEAEWHPMRLGRLPGFGRIMTIDYSARVHHKLAGGEELRLADMPDGLWEKEQSASMTGRIAFCGDRCCARSVSLLLRVEDDETTDAEPPSYWFDYYQTTFLSGIEVAKGFRLRYVKVASDASPDDGNRYPLRVFLSGPVASLRAANGVRFRIEPDTTENGDGERVHSGEYDIARDSLDLTLHRVEFDVGKGLVAQAREVRVRHTPRMGPRQPWLAVDSLWVTRRTAGKDASPPVLVTTGTSGKKHLLTVSATGAKIDRKAIRKACAAGRQEQGGGR